MSIRSMAFKRVLMATAAIVSVATAQGQTFSWNHPGGSGDVWSNPAEWSENGLPTSYTPTNGSSVYLESESSAVNQNITGDVGTLSLALLSSQYTNLNNLSGSLTVQNLGTQLSNFSLTSGTLTVTGSLQDGGGYDYGTGYYTGGTTFNIDANSIFNVNNGSFGVYATSTLNGRPEGTQSGITNYGLAEFTSSAITPTQIEYSTLNNYGTLAADYLLLFSDGAVANTGTFSSTQSLEIAGDQNGVTVAPTNVTNTGTLTAKGLFTLDEYASLNTSGVGKTYLNGDVQLNAGYVVTTNGDQQPPQYAAPETLEATNGGTVLVGQTTPVGSFIIGNPNIVLQPQPNLIPGPPTGGLVTADGVGSTLTINAVTVDSAVAQVWAGQQYNSVFSATDGGALTINAQTFNMTVTSAGQEHDNFGDFAPVNAITYADGSGSLLTIYTTLNPFSSINLSRTVYPDTHALSTYNYYEQPTPLPFIYASNGGTVDLTSATINLNGLIVSETAGSNINVTANAIYNNGGLGADVGGTLTVGTQADPVALIQGNGGIAANNIDPTSTFPGHAASLVTLFASQYNGLAPGGTVLNDALGAYGGSTLSLTGSTYFGGFLVTESNLNVANAMLSVTESTSAEGLGNIQAYSGEVNVSAPLIDFGQTAIITGESVLGVGGSVYLTATSSISLNESSAYSLPSYEVTEGLYAEGSGTTGVESPIEIQAPTVTVQDMGLRADYPGAVVDFDPSFAPGNTVTLSNVGFLTSSQVNYGPGSALDGGIVTATGSEVVIGKGSTIQAGAFPGYGQGTPATSYVLLNNEFFQSTISYAPNPFSGQVLDAQNSGLISSAAFGELLVGGNTLENESTGTITVGANSATYLGYTQGAPGTLPAVASDKLATSNAGTINVYGDLYSYGSITNSNTFNISDTGSDVVDIPSGYSGTIGPYPYEPGYVELTGGSLSNSGTMTVLASSLQIDDGDLDNSGMLTIADDLSVQQGYGGTALNSSVTVYGDFHGTAGAASVLGSSLTVTGTLGTAGQFTVSDDTSGGTAFGNNYPVQYSTISAGGITNTGKFTSTESTLNIGSYGLNNNGGTFYALADDTLPTPAGTTISIPNGELTNAGSMQLVGSTVTIGTGTSPAAVGLSNTGGGIDVYNDYTAYISGTATAPLLGSITVANGDLQNSGGHINLFGTSLTVSTGNVYNSGTGQINVQDDLTAPAGLGIVQGALSIPNGSLNITGGQVSVVGSTVTIGNNGNPTTYNLNVGYSVGNLGGAFSISDDSMGYPSTFNLPNGAITVSGTGNFTATETSITANAITNQDNGNFTVQDDATLANPVGSTVYVGSITNQGSAYFNVVGSNVYINFDSLSSGFTNSGSGVMNISNDSLAYVTSGGTSPIVLGTLYDYGYVATNTGNAIINIFGGGLQAFGANFVNSGNATININGDSYGDSGGINAGTFTNSGNAVVNLNPAGLGPGSYISASGTFTNRDQGIVNIGAVQGDTSVVVAGNFINGASQSDAAKVYVYGGISLQSGGFFQTGSGSLLKVYGTVQSGTPNVSVQLGNVGDPAGSAGFLGGSGTIGNPSSPISVVNNAGTVNPGDPQILTIDGDYFQGANGALDINIDGPGGAGVGNDKLVVNGDVTLGGTLDLIFGNGYAPTGPIEFLDFTGSLTGRFGTLEETVGGNTFGLPGMISYGANGITFTPQAVPEPGCWLAFGAGGLVLFRRRKAAKISK